LWLKSGTSTVRDKIIGNLYSSTWSFMHVIFSTVDLTLKWYGKLFPVYNGKTSLTYYHFDDIILFSTYTRAESGTGLMAIGLFYKSSDV